MMVLLTLFLLFFASIMFELFRISWVKKTMRERFGFRQCSDSEVVFGIDKINSIPLNSKKRLLELVHLFKYPSPECMLASDRLSDLMELHNYLYLHWQFEDVGEILDMMDIGVADFANDLNYTPQPIGDLIELFRKFDVSAGAQCDQSARH